MSITKSFALLSLTCLLGVALAGPATAAGRRDRDHDGLSDKQERRYRTNPRKADTDRDGLKDGREVRLGTNPRRADSDRDGLKDGREVKLKTNPRKADSDGDGVRDDRELRAGSNPRRRDSDGDGLDDLYEVGRKGDAEEVQGTLSAVGADTVSITAEDGSITVASVDKRTRLRAPDVNGDDQVTLADFQVGDRVEAHLEAGEDGPHALSLKREKDEQEGEDQDGQGPGRPGDEDPEGEDPGDNPGDEEPGYDPGDDEQGDED